MRASQIIRQLLNEDDIVYLSAPEASSWEPSILSLSGKALKVVHREGDKILVKDPEDPRGREVITFKTSEVSSEPVMRGAARSYYDKSLSKQTDIDPDEGAREHDSAAASEIENHMGDWKAFSNGEAKMRAMQIVQFNPVIRMNSLRLLYSDLIHAGKLPSKFGFQKFLKTPLTIWRGSNLAKDNPISTTWDPSRTGIFGSSYKVSILPEKITYYIGGGECEVLVDPRVFRGQAKR